MITVQSFVQEMKDKKIMNTKIAPDAVAKYIKENLEITTYIPFTRKRLIADMIVDANTEEIDGVWKNDSISQYISFVVAMIQEHTNLVFEDNPVDDYDMLAENELLVPIIETFRNDYNECDVVLKMALASKLEDNSINTLVGKFLNGILGRIDVAEEFLKSTIGSIDLQEIMNNFFCENLADNTANSACDQDLHEYGVNRWHASDGI